ncbi:MAG: phytanoyl-CoA dioxygenase family protein [Gammaproteobacteria bacterium]|nr:phytanoyl-CoA dioxygenase family protein [Gammaproteobacteria bacterium]
MPVTPPPRTSLADAKSDLDEHGLAVVVEALSPAQTSDVRARLDVALEASEADGVPTRGYAFDPDLQNRRVFHLFNYDPVFCDLIQRPAALEFVRHMLGDSFLISNFSANITEPGNQPMQLHADQGYVVPPWPAIPLACNVAWVLDDFTEENGGTCYVPGSHLKGHGPELGREYETVPIDAPAGSMLLMDGRLWHCTGANRTADCKRAALFGYYVLRWIRPQMSWNTTLWPATVENLDPEFLDLLGYYTGNTEYQVPHGRGAREVPPAELAARSSQDFVLSTPSKRTPRDIGTARKEM